MSLFFVDESLHPRGGFALASFVRAEADPALEIQAGLLQAGLTPGVDEFKSGSHVGRDPRQADARDRLWNVLMDSCRVGLLVAPISARNQLGLEALAALRQFAEANRLAETPHVVYFDQGILHPASGSPEDTRSTQLPPSWRMVPNADSKSVLGLQLADLVAHAASLMLLEEQGVISKLVKAGPNSSYDPDLELDLGFEMWAGLRWRFFGGPVPHPDTWKSQADFCTDVEPYGLYVSPLCPPDLAAHARNRFGRMYLGCIH